MRGAIVLNGAPNGGARLIVNGAATLAGGGTLTLSDAAAANNSITTFVAGSTLDNIDNVISGSGTIGGLAITNEAGGTIDATGTNNALIVAQSLTNKGLLEATGTAGLQIGGYTITNGAGTISASGTGAHVDLNNTTIQGGTLTTSGGGVLGVTNNVSLDGSTPAGAVTVSGAVAGPGTLAVSAGATTFASGATLSTANLSGGSGATLDVAENLTYAGVVANVGTIAIAGGDTLDLAGAVSGAGAIDLAGTGGVSTLALETTAQPANGGTFGNSLANFGATSALDLENLSFSATLGNGAFYDPATGLLSVTESGNTENFTLSNPATGVFMAQADSAGTGTLVTETVVCFASGTLIATARGDIAVEALRPGDMAMTASGALRPIIWIGSRVVDCAALPLPSGAWPVRIRAGAFGCGLPERDLYLSPGHPVLVGRGDEEVLVPIMCLINGTSIARMPVETITYWHVELDEHAIILAEGLPAESFLDWGNRPWFENAADNALTNPDFIPPGLDARCRPVAIDGPIVEAERRRLDIGFAASLSAQCAWPAGDALGATWS